VKQDKNKDLIQIKEWQKPTLVTLSVSFTKEDCTGKVEFGSPDGNSTCTWANVATS
jgi:hypothetical protein